MFGESTRAAEVIAPLDLTGMRVFITGVSAGLGVETARAMVGRGAVVVGTARDIGKARKATADIQGPGRIELAECDLGSLARVQTRSEPEGYGGGKAYG